MNHLTLIYSNHHTPYTSHLPPYNPPYPPTCHRRPPCTDVKPITTNHNFSKHVSRSFNLLPRHSQEEFLHFFCDGLVTCSLEVARHHCQLAVLANTVCHTAIVTWSCATDTEKNKLDLCWVGYICENEIQVRIHV